MTITETLTNVLIENPVARFLDTRLQNLIINTLRTGRLPKHVAFIMDGNRRFAKGKGLKTYEGHEAGSASLAKILETCYLLDVKHVTIYAFSIENFNRSKEEVETLFDLLIKKLNLLIENSGELRYQETQIRIIGNKSLIPKETLEKLEKIEALTMGNNRMILNVCFSYTSRDEIAHSIGRTVTDVVKHDLLVDQINQEVIKSNFYFKYNDTPEVDILIRTSGHTRLSDFLIWQVNEHSNIEFLNVYWPDFKSTDFYLILLKYGFNTALSDKLNEIYARIWPYNNAQKVTKPTISLQDLPKPPPFVSILGEKN